jgi:hypothetical protein
VYLAWLVVIVLASYALAIGAITAVNALHLKGGGWGTVALNLVAPFIAGVMAGIAAVHILSRRNQLVATVRGHLLRTKPWYLFAGFLALYIASSYADPDFSLVSQLAVWPLCGTIGALLVNILASWRSAPSTHGGAIA